MGFLDSIFGPIPSQVKYEVPKKEACWYTRGQDYYRTLEDKVDGIYEHFVIEYYIHYNAVSSKGESGIIEGYSKRYKYLDHYYELAALVEENKVQSKELIDKLEKTYRCFLIEEKKRKEDEVIRRRNEAMKKNGLLLEFLNENSNCKKEKKY